MRESVIRQNFSFCWKLPALRLPVVRFRLVSEFGGSLFGSSDVIYMDGVNKGLILKNACLETKSIFYESQARYKRFRI